MILLELVQDLPSFSMTHSYGRCSSVIYIHGDEERDQSEKGKGKIQTREPILKVPEQIFCKMLLDSLVISKTEEKRDEP